MAKTMSVLLLLAAIPASAEKLSRVQRLGYRFFPTRVERTDNGLTTRNHALQDGKPLVIEEKIQTPGKLTTVRRMDVKLNGKRRAVKLTTVADQKSMTSESTLEVEGGLKMRWTESHKTVRELTPFKARAKQLQDSPLVWGLEVGGAFFLGSWAYAGKLLWSMKAAPLVTAFFASSKTVKTSYGSGVNLLKGEVPEHMIDTLLLDSSPK